MQNVSAIERLEAARDYAPSPVAGLPAHVFDLPPWMRRHPVAVDTSALNQDVVWRVRHDFSALTWLGKQGLAALVAPSYVDDEVYRRLPKVARETGCSVDEAMRVWETIHRPLIRFVDMPDAGDDDERVAALMRRHPNDVPLARLALLLAPSVVIAADHDLTDTGFGDPDWLGTLHLLGQLTELDSLLWGGSRLAWLSIYLPGLAASGLVRQLIRSGLAFGVAIGVAIGIGLYFRAQLRESATSVKARVGPPLTRLTEAAALKFEERAGTDHAFQSHLVKTPAPRTLESVIARRLVAQTEPLPSARIHAELVRAGYEVSLPATRELLRDNSAFVGVPGHGYELGRSAAGSGPS